MIPLPPYMDSFPHYHHALPEWYIFYNWWTYIDTVITQSPYFIKISYLFTCIYYFKGKQINWSVVREETPKGERIKTRYLRTDLKSFILKTRRCRGLYAVKLIYWRAFNQKETCIFLYVPKWQDWGHWGISGYIGCGSV